MGRRAERLIEDFQVFPAPLIAMRCSRSLTNVVMLLTPLPGTSRDDLIQALQAVRDSTTNQMSGGSTGQRRVMNYLDWAGQAVKTLRRKISEADLRALLLTPQYDHLLSGFGHMASSDTQTQRVINELVTMEVSARAADLDAAIATLKSYEERMWVPHPAAPPAQPKKQAPQRPRRGGQATPAKANT